MSLFEFSLLGPTYSHAVMDASTRPFRLAVLLISTGSDDGLCVLHRIRSSVARLGRSMSYSETRAAVVSLASCCGHHHTFLDRIR